MLSENVWDRKFGEPLPTLANVVKKHQMTEVLQILDAGAKAEGRAQRRVEAGDEAKG